MTLAFVPDVVKSIREKESDGVGKLLAKSAAAPRDQHSNESSTRQGLLTPLSRMASQRGPPGATSLEDDMKGSSKLYKHKLFSTRILLVRFYL